MRRWPVHRWSLFGLGLLLLLLSLSGCLDRPLLSDLAPAEVLITPNGQGLHPTARIGFRLGTRAAVSAVLRAPDGREFVLRDRAMRAPDEYEITLDGTVAIPGSSDRRVLPNGTYTLIVTAEDDQGRRESRSARVIIAEADTTPVEITNLQTDRPFFTPDGDGDADDVRITYGLTKPAEVQVYVTDTEGNHYLIDPPTQRNATLQAHVWDGTTGGRQRGGKLLPDGQYTIHVEARDAAGNFTHRTVPVEIRGGGTPRLEIVEVRFSPITLAYGAVLDVQIKVKNTGTVPLKTNGPPPGTLYTTEQNYASFRDPNRPGEPLYYERPGTWRVGVSWENAPQAFPIRWGLFADLNRLLMPGEEVVVEGKIRILERPPSRTLRFFAGVIQEGVGYPGGRVGDTVITINF